MPVPAVLIVLTTAVLPFTKRSAPPDKSVTHKPPLPSAETALGALKRAAVNWPSVTTPATPARPAKVEMVPLG
jgi:hypothetical protein